MIGSIKKTLKKFPKQQIVFPEPEDERVIEAVIKLKKAGIVNPILIGKRAIATKTAKKLGKAYKKDLTKIAIIEPYLRDDFIHLLYSLRKHKGMTLPKAKRLVLEPIYYATLMLLTNEADGLISGAAHPTAHTLRPALQLIKTKKQGWIASSCFLLIKKGKKPLLFADCGMNIKPNAEQLAQIALETGETALFFGFKPTIALLSFSTKGSAHHEEVDKVKEATRIAKKYCKKNKKSWKIDGELQFDAAFVPEVGKRKAPKSSVAGKANVFIFPDLNTGNISYKIAQRLGHYKAIGPIVQGLKKPVNDLSRGCNVEEIIDLAYITALQAAKGKETKSEEKKTKRTSKKKR